MDLPQLHAYLYGTPIPQTLPSITRSVLLAWRTALRHTRWEKLTQQTPLWHGSWLSEKSFLTGFQSWDRIGISLLGDIWAGDHIQSFAELQARHSLHTSQFYRYLQLRHALAVHISTGTSLPEFSPPEAQVLMGSLGKGGVSKIHRSLVNNTPTNLDSLRARCEGCIGPLEEADWCDALMAPRTLTTSFRLHLIQLYYLHIAYLTPAQLHRAGLRPSPACARCGLAPADFSLGVDLPGPHPLLVQDRVRAYTHSRLADPPRPNAPATWSP